MTVLMTCFYWCRCNDRMSQSLIISGAMNYICSWAMMGRIRIIIQLYLPLLSQLMMIRLLADDGSHVRRLLLSSSSSDHNDTLYSSILVGLFVGIVIVNIIIYTGISFSSSSVSISSTSYSSSSYLPPRLIFR